MTVNAANPDFQAALYYEAGDYVVVSNGTSGHLFRVGSVASGPTDGNETDPWVLNIEDINGDSQVDTLCGGGLFTSPADDYPAGAFVIRARWSRYAICSIGGAPYLILGDADGDCDPAGGDFEPIARGIEDLQVAVGIDANDDGVLAETGAAADDDEWIYNFAGDTAPTLLSAEPRWDALRITVIGISQQEVSDEQVSFRPVAEDHAGASTADEHRRRSLTTVLDLRNIQ